MTEEIANSEKGHKGISRMGQKILSFIGTLKKNEKSRWNDLANSRQHWSTNVGIIYVKVIVEVMRSGSSSPEVLKEYKYREERKEKGGKEQI